MFVISQTVSAQCCIVGGFQQKELAATSVPSHDDFIVGKEYCSRERCQLRFIFGWVQKADEAAAPHVSDQLRAFSK